jgi:SAM-dependent methyltransferase
VSDRRDDDTATAAERDYVLGTHDEELRRLGLQHRVWRPTVLAAWRTAGIRRGSSVVDVGAGPGFASADLAELVGPKGRVEAIERSGRFVEHARRLAAARGLAHLHFQEADLMDTPIAGGPFDAAWCRWVACFVSSPRTLVARLAAALKPGGAAIFHEYADYRTYSLVPTRPGVERFVAEVMANWRSTGGEPDIARELPGLLASEGFRVESAIPRVFAVRPHEELWKWPAGFIETHLDRLLELGRIDEAFAASVRSELADATRDGVSLLMTPLVLEIIARRK